MIYFKKGTKLLCKACGSHLLTLAVDAIQGTLVTEAMFDRTAGQAPWNHQDKLSCRECDKAFDFSRGSTIEVEPEGLQ